MKNILRITCLVLFAFLAASFFGCGKSGESDTEKPDVNNLIGPYSLTEGGMSFSFDITDSRVYIYEPTDTSVIYQTFPHTGVADLEASKNGFFFADMNFDGYGDFAFPLRVENGLQYYYAYLWDENEKLFALSTELMHVGDLKVADGYVTGTEIVNGVPEEVRYYFENGAFTEEHMGDAAMDVALAYIKGYLDNENLTADYAKRELVDKCLCRFYFIYDGEEIVAYTAVNYDGSRVFYSDRSDVYFELVKENGGYKKGAASYSRMVYTGDVFTAVSAAYETLNTDEKEIYGSAYAKIIDFKDVSYSEPEAERALTALMADNPLLYSYFDFTADGEGVKGKYFYAWAPYEYDISTEEIRRLTYEYSVFFDRMIDDMPTGLQPLEKYLYLAQALQIQMKEDDEPEIGLLINGDTEGVRIARTFMYMCDKAQVYCTSDGEINTVLLDGEKTELDLWAAFRYTPGSEGWLDALFN